MLPQNGAGEALAGVAGEPAGLVVVEAPAVLGGVS